MLDADKYVACGKAAAFVPVVNVSEPLFRKPSVELGDVCC